MNRGERRKAERRARRAGSATGELVSQIIAIEGAAISEAVSKGASAFDLAVAHLEVAIEGVVEQGGDFWRHGVITVGQEHPDYPGCLVIEAKTDRMLPAQPETPEG